MFKLGHFSVYFILLVGVILGTFFRSITSFIQLIMDPESFLAVQSAMFASFEASNSRLVLVSTCLLLVLIIITVIMRPFRCTTTGRAQAINLGVSRVNDALATHISGTISFYFHCFSWSCYIFRIVNCNLAHELMKKPRSPLSYFLYRMQRKIVDASKIPKSNITEE